MTENPCLLAVQKPLLNHAALSHRGKVRQNNEDRLAIRFFLTKEPPPQPVVLAVLSDGVGGHRSGEIAAQIGISAILAFFETTGSLDDPASVLCDALVAANLAVLEASTAKPELSGMGATCICTLILNNTLFLAYLGDSRAYLLRGRSIRQLNYDHTVLEEIGDFSMPRNKGNTRTHPLAHVLSRYLGSAHPAGVDARIRPPATRLHHKPSDSFGMDLLSRDRVLLCSDGLTDMLSDTEIREAITGKSVEKDVQKLVLCALEKGGHDNISVVLLEIP